MCRGACPIYCWAVCFQAVLCLGNTYIYFIEIAEKKISIKFLKTAFDTSNILDFWEICVVSCVVFTLYVSVLSSFTIFRLKEVRSKILILLETTGGISFSLEGVWKVTFFNLKLYACWFIIHWRESDIFLGVYNSTGGIQISFLGVYNSIGGIQIYY